VHGSRRQKKFHSAARRLDVICAQLLLILSREIRFLPATHRARRPQGCAGSQEGSLVYRSRLPRAPAGACSAQGHTALRLPACHATRQASCL
jgi:hypothetical protein